MTFYKLLLFLRQYIVIANPVTVTMSKILHITTTTINHDVFTKSNYSLTTTGVVLLVVITMGLVSFIK